MPPLRLLLFSVLLAVLGSGCASLDIASRVPLPPLKPIGPPPPEYYWDGDGVPGSPSIVINLSEQKGYFFKGKNLVGETEISTGRTGFRTPPGRYHIIQKERHHRSTLYGDYVNSSDEVVKSNVDINRSRRPAGSHFRGASMPYFMRIRDGYGLHAGFLPGFPASHGCIRLPEEMAMHFYHSAPTGTRVRVTE